MHTAEGNYLFTKVFNRAADEIDGIVDNQKSVVHILTILNDYGCILSVMSTQIITYLRVLRVGINDSRHSFTAFGKYL